MIVIACMPSAPAARAISSIESLPSLYVVWQWNAPVTSLERDEIGEVVARALVGAVADLGRHPRQAERAVDVEFVGLRQRPARARRSFATCSGEPVARMNAQPNCAGSREVDLAAHAVCEPRAITSSPAIDRLVTSP